MNPRYQVFVSSTYEDLKEERSAVLHALLRARFIPAGMELFTAGNQPPWDKITRSIDESDYYALIIGGRYGSFVPDSDISYTEREYRYALEKGVPIIAFIPARPESIPVGKTDSTDERKRTKLSEFITLVQEKTVETWEGANDLAHKLVTAVALEAQSNPRIGWVRGNHALTSEHLSQSLDLQRRVEELKAENEALRSSLGTQLAPLPKEAEILLRCLLYPDVSVIYVASDGSYIDFNPGSKSVFWRPESARSQAKARSAINTLSQRHLIHVVNSGRPYYKPSGEAFDLALAPLNPAITPNPFAETQV